MLKGLGAAGSAYDRYMSNTSEPRPQMSVGRVEAFSDGVLAIAITLLILDVRVAEGEASLAHRMLDAWPQYFAYAVTFMVIGVMWVNHHALFANVDRVDRGIQFVNLSLLAAISFLPFPTNVLAEHMRSSSKEDTIAAVVLYSLNCLLVAAAFFALWAYLGRRPHLLHGAVGQRHVRGSQRRALVGPIGYLAAIPLAYITPLLSLLVYGALAVWFAFGNRHTSADS